MSLTVICRLFVLWAEYTLLWNDPRHWRFSQKKKQDYWIARNCDLVSTNLQNLFMEK